MQTTCPECKTTFRLSQEQLGLRRGLVRCGRCKAVFNAYLTLLPDLVTPAEPQPPEQPVPPEPPAPLAPPLTLPPEPVLPVRLFQPMPEPPPAADALSLLESLRDSDLPEPLVTLSGQTPPTPAPPPAPVTPPAVAASSENILLTELPARTPKAVMPLWQITLYSLASGVLLAMLIAQLVYFLRGDLAAWFPGMRPALTSLCAQVGCQVPLPHALDKRAIVASSLEHDAERKSRVRLTLLLANRTDDVQAWPQLMLTLTDVHEAPVAVKTFPPEAYLPGGTKVAAGMKRDSEREIRLDLDLGKLEAAGYSLDLLYP